MLMYRIAICDDEKSTCAEIESYILMYSKLRFIRNEIEVFYSGEAFCEYVKQGNFFDLLFLDIELPAINGIEVNSDEYVDSGNKEIDSTLNYLLQKADKILDNTKISSTEPLINGEILI